jgi:GTP-binding protein
VLLANKCEGREALARLPETQELGFGEALPISAEQGDGLDLLYEALAQHLPATAGPAEAAGSRPIKLAILGRPNVGKSTLVNRLLGRERMLTGPEPGTTRDAVATLLDWQGQAVELWDTAGLRRRARIDKAPERLAAEDTLRALRFAEVAVLLLDATLALEHQDLTIAEHVLQEGRALIVAVNKWDLVSDGKRRLASLRQRLESSLAQVKGLKPVPLSARSGKGVERLMPAVMAAHARWERRIATGELNRWLAAATQSHPPPLGRGGRRIRIRYITQAKSRPPTFVLFASQADALPETYLRYLGNGLTEAFDLAGVPLRLLLRQPRNPYAEKGA